MPINTREIVEKWAQDWHDGPATNSHHNLADRIMAALAAEKESTYQPAPIMMVAHTKGITVMFVIGGELDRNRVCVLNPDRPVDSEKWCLYWDRVDKVPEWALRAIAAKPAPERA